MRRKTLLILALLVLPAVMAAAPSDIKTVGTAGVTAVQVRAQAQNRQGRGPDSFDAHGPTNGICRGRRLSGRAIAVRRRRSNGHPPAR